MAASQQDNNGGEDSKNQKKVGGWYSHYVLFVLVIVYVFNFLDRNILSILAEDIKADLAITDAQMGFLYGTVFAVFYAVFGIPLARFADVWNRRSLISVGLFFWSAMTALSGFAKSFPMLATFRIGVGVGEASASPAAYSMLSDYYPPRLRATVLALYSSGVYIGGGLGLIIGGWIVDAWAQAFPVDPPLGLKGWQAAFLAVGLPGVLMAIGFLIAVAVLGLVYRYPIGRWYTPREALQHLVHGIPAGNVPVVIVGGILAGIATPTESAALAAVSAFVVGKFFYRNLDIGRLPAVLLSTVRTSAMVLFLIGVANVFGWVIVFEKVPQTMAVWLTELTQDPFVFLLLVSAFMLIIGMVIDGIAALILVVPILLPVASGVYGISPFHFGVLVCITVVLGLVTPPVGAGLFVASSAANVSPGRLFLALTPFLLTTVIVLVLLCWQPGLITALIQ